MWRFAVSFALAAAALTAQAAPSSPTSGTSSVAITGVTVVDVASGRLVPRQTVVVRGNRVVAVGPDRKATAPAGAKVVDGTGKFLIPAEMRGVFASSPPSPAFESLRPHMGWLAIMMQRAGVGILAGTDTYNPYVLPGFSLHDELALLVEAGLSPLEALQAATLNPARFLNATASQGAIAPGKLADLVLLDANPLADIHNTTQIRAVVANGRYLDRAALDAVLAGVERAASPPAQPTP